MPWKEKEISYTDGEDEKSLKIIEVDRSGNPIWVHENDGKEVGVDAKHYFTKIPQLIEEKKSLKNAKEDAEKELQTIKSKFSEIEDPEEAIKAIQIVQNLDDKKLVDSKKVEQLKLQLKEQYDKALEKKDIEHKTVVDKLQSDLLKVNNFNYRLTISNEFKGSKLLNGKESKYTIPVEVAEKYWGENFKAEDVDGKLRITAFYPNGQPIYSDNKPGELADFDEAIQKLIEASPFKESITKGVQQSGGGVNPNSSSHNVETQNRMTVENYTKMSDFKSNAEKQAFIEKKGLEAFKEIMKKSRITSPVGAQGTPGVTDMGAMRR